ncbi:MAG: hypothetical protein GDA45_03680 [Chromatiales bacterium]|nr:hypothetical protein [Chromatiales bacterium]
MVRLKTRWNLEKGARTHSETASVISTNIWRIITQSLLDMENQGFSSESNAQRLDILVEFAAYAIHLLDRYIYNSTLMQERQKIVFATARHLAEIIRDNRHDAKDGINGRESFPILLNRRSDEYSECHYDGEPGFNMRRILGEYAGKIIRCENRKWAVTYILDIESYNIHDNLIKVLDNFLTQPES